jgi:YHS domain-containing protein
MITTTLDPISLNDVTDIENAPFHVEGTGDCALKIYFESEHNKQEYLNTPLHGSDGGSTALNGIYDGIAESPITGSIN